MRTSWWAILDSLREAPNGGEVVRLPAEKDDTDMVAALRLALERGCRDIRLYGASGGRIDHTIANLQSLNFLARQGARGVLVEEHYSVTSILNGEIRFAAASRGMLSVFAQGGEARGVYLEGLKYPQHGFTLRDDYPMGVSNEFTGIPARVAVTDGMLLGGLDGGGHRRSIEQAPRREDAEPFSALLQKNRPKRLYLENTATATRETVDMILMKMSRQGPDGVP